MKQKVGSIGERIAVSGAGLLDWLKDVITEGNLRQLIIQKPSGEVLVKVPLTAGVLVSAILTLLAPTIVALVAMAALVYRFQVEIIRTHGDED